MSDAIVIEGLSKRYKLFRSKAAKIADLFGITLNGSHEEFWALRDVTLRVGRGEKVGLIGRNGAGKTTLLGVIAGNSAPTSGSVRVNGKVNALFTLGTGFHPEFTGRENIVSSLAFQGVTGKEARRLSEEIIEFAELEGFIEQPVKTYSAGMYARLAFTVATAVRPEIIIIDEILGAGDAYFASKCVERMKRLTAEAGATVLFVSHDMSSVEMLCDRSIWLERGRLVMDSTTPEVSKAYMQMIREKTARRIMEKNRMLALANGRTRRKLHEARLQIILRFVLEGGSGVEVSRVELRLEGSAVHVDVGEPQDNSMEYEGFVLLDTFSAWGRPSEEGGVHYRGISSPPSCSAVVFNLDGLSSAAGAEVIIRWRGRGVTKTRVEVFDGRNYRLASHLEGGDTGWIESMVKIDPSVVRDFMASYGIVINERLEGAAQVNAQHPAGADAPADGAKDELAGLDRPGPIIPVADDDGELFDGSVAIERVSFVNGEGREAGVFKSFEKMSIHIDYHVRKGPVKAEFVVCIHRIGAIMLQALSGLSGKDLALNDGERGRCTLEIPSLPMGKGRYMVSVAVFPPLDYTSLDTEKTAYVLHDRRYEIAVEQPEEIVIDLGVCRCPVEWSFSAGPGADRKMKGAHA